MDEIGILIEICYKLGVSARIINFFKKLKGKRRELLKSCIYDLLCYGHILGQELPWLLEEEEKNELYEEWKRNRGNG